MSMSELPDPLVTDEVAGVPASTSGTSGDLAAQSVRELVAELARTEAMLRTSPEGRELGAVARQQALIVRELRRRRRAAPGAS